MTELDELVQRLREGKNWLNEGRCCGDVDSNGVCAAPACIFGDALKEFSEAADALEHMAASHDALVAEIDALRKERDEALRELDAIYDALGTADAEGAPDAATAIATLFKECTAAIVERDAAIARAVKAEKERDAISTRFEKALVEGTKRREERDALRTALREAVEALASIINDAEMWCDAVDKNSSWDGWDHYFKSMKWKGIPAYRTVLSKIEKLVGEG